METRLLSIEAKSYAELKERLVEAYGLEDDDQSLLDSLEGATNLKEMIVASIRHARRKEAFAKALSELIADNRRRQQRMEHAAENVRAAVTLAMETAGLPRVESADFTISFRQAKPAPVVTDETLLPDWAIRVKKEPNKLLINERYKFQGDDFECPGVSISNGSAGIVVRST